MRYLSFRAAAGPVRAGVLDPAASGKVHDVTDLLPPGEGSPMRRLIAAVAAGLDVEGTLSRSPVLDLGDVTAIAPVPDPTKVVAAPVNYRNHQSEMGQAGHIDSLGVFLKAPSSVVGAGAVVTLPYHDRRFDQEGELAAVIGKTARHVTEADALDHVFGYTSLLDMTMRGGEDRSVRKSFDTFTPTGPTIVSPGAVPPVEELELRLWVNGALRQRADLKDLIWGLPKLIAYVSTVMTLGPGDIVTTGTPEGVGEVFDGDRIDVEVTGLDRLTVTVSSAGAVACPTRGAGRGPRPPERLTPVSERS
ncbi:fumarylacetoacetate hydrolase family protein [Actinomadura madurae]|uniref:2-keto-4-pentenoate hydratase/2-oxohepta-3-ene-1,7-dioic acid hydratase (Catechol pathway) n=1 Tax=Actinomadura madurae TaxID=1993 RepID=A0A1I5GM54_9ACTN|nr:fumarylacetoacetate hydrolase family protein [Actinomadura madurae]SFO37032.1 2-keto-4-pentenoate hydratase/2-oxohepta-3-ene-1,7-dioic acid hydratase (catechol pathway) [Actinomadura madurae]SPT51397.1 Homoprotocatechuate catabolism bifunctional isomerase/decarboxylase [Actinomadura madurae]